MFPGLLSLVLVLAAQPAAAAQPQPSTASARSAAMDRARPYPLMVGDPAPALAVTEWLKGEPVPELRRGRIYVLTFWASWCSSCIAEFPALSRVQEKYRDKGVTLIAIARPDSNGCTLEEIRTIMEARGGDMNFAVAWDGALTTHAAWMRASGRRGIPASFVIDQNGRVAAIDAGAAPVDRIVAQLLGGTYDLKGAAEEYRVGAVSGIDTEAFVEKIRAKDYTGAYAFARRALERELNDCAGWLSVVAWESMDPRREKETWDLDLAWRCAERANALTPQRDNCDVLNTYARACFLKGDVRGAIDAQQRTVDLMKAEGNDLMVESFGANLAEYKAALESKK